MLNNLNAANELFKIAQIRDILHQSINPDMLVKLIGDLSPNAFNISYYNRGRDLILKLPAKHVLAKDSVDVMTKGGLPFVFYLNMFFCKEDPLESIEVENNYDTIAITFRKLEEGHQLCIDLEKTTEGEELGDWGSSTTTLLTLVDSRLTDNSLNDLLLTLSKTLNVMVGVYCFTKDGTIALTSHGLNRLLNYERARLFKTILSENPTICKLEDVNLYYFASDILRNLWRSNQVHSTQTNPTDLSIKVKTPIALDPFSTSYIAKNIYMLDIELNVEMDTMTPYFIVNGNREEKHYGVHIFLYFLDDICKLKHN